ncbi:6283_t:CDS:10 [Funneliformis mosseae]|uniref:6283_t:CDS:1 n=1 Tax=Funneliformis mosseae TaxID=27381 RepID=A0A9N8YYL6_FUNMO|nr:6283_t:CDS:10 [Funneliformis mosseae]
MTIFKNRKTFFVSLCLLLFFNGIGLLWKKRISEKNSSLSPGFGIKNRFRKTVDFSIWKGNILEPTTAVLSVGANSTFIKNSDTRTSFNNECDNIYSHPDKCDFVRKHCRDYSSGLIDYLQFYFCNSPKWHYVYLMTLFLWLLFLFGFIGLAASEFFCPNLSTIASKLKLSESMAGVTFLAFGNGSPDLFSTFSAISLGSGSLAIGELIGAASFITSVVAGSMAVVSPFRVTKAPFLRDVIFFLVAISFVLTIISDGKIHLWESITLVLFYLTYVSVVVIGTWWVKDQKRRIWQEQKARDEYTPTSLNNGDTENLEEQTEEEFENQDAYGYDTYVETDLLLSEGERIPDYTGRNASPISMTPLTNSEPREYFLSPNDLPIRPIHRRMRPSFFGAIEFRDVVNSLKLDSSARALDIFGRSHSTDFYNSRSDSPRSRTMSFNRPIFGSRKRSWASDGGGIITIPESPIMNSNSLNGSGHSSGSRSLTQPPLSKQKLGDALTIPRLMLIPPTPDHGPDSPDKGSSSRSSPLPLTLETSNFILDGLLHSSPGNSPLHSPSLSSPSPPVISCWDKIQVILFPTLEGFSQKSYIAKLITLMATPANLLLTLTLPVVESDEVDFNEVEKESCLRPQLAIVIDDDPDMVIVESPDEDCKETRWNRWLTAAQFVFSPLFVSSVLFFGDNSSIILYSFLGGTVAATACIIFTHDDKPPRFYSLLCFMGFGVGMVWIFLVANEVVGLLQAIGLIMGLSDAILGLTIFAMGNSLGDFVANITIARMGFPMMAMSACFGGPMLNILLGIGIAGTYTTIQSGEPVYIEIDPTLFISSIGLLLTLFSALFYLPRNDFRMTRGSETSDTPDTTNNDLPIPDPKQKGKEIDKNEVPVPKGKLSIQERNQEENPIGSDCHLVGSQKNIRMEH